MEKELDGGGGGRMVEEWMGDVEGWRDRGVERGGMEVWREGERERGRDGGMERGMEGWREGWRDGEGEGDREAGMGGVERHWHKQMVIAVDLTW